jgi:hypothetical protein
MWSDSNLSAANHATKLRTLHMEVGNSVQPLTAAGASS